MRAEAALATPSPALTTTRLERAMANRKPLSKILNGVTRFGRLTVVGEAPSKIAASGFEARCALVRCDCGTEKIVRACCLSHGDTSSCGCFQREELGKAARTRTRTHGESRGGGKRGTTEFIIWSGMKQRCYGTTSKHYGNYGGRGISICERWLGPDGFENFLADMGRRPSKRHSIDRINNDGNYEPGNCRWATASEQARNRRPFMVYAKGTRPMVNDPNSLLLAQALAPFAEVAAWAERNGHDLNDFDMLLRGPQEQIAGHLQVQSPDFIKALEMIRLIGAEDLLTV
jgi:hypothetical protein